MSGADFGGGGRNVSRAGDGDLVIVADEAGACVRNAAVTINRKATHSDGCYYMAARSLLGGQPYEVTVSVPGHARQVVHGNVRPGYDIVVFLR